MKYLVDVIKYQGQKELEEEEIISDHILYKSIIKESQQGLKQKQHQGTAYWLPPPQGMLIMLSYTT